jgi:osmoprotectant transport system substrate-binding protein
MAKLISVFIGAVVVALASSPYAFAQRIVVGGKAFTEQRLLTEMTSQLLKANGFEPDSRGGMGSGLVRQAIENGQIDVYWDYTGTVLNIAHKINDRMSAQEGYNRVKNLDAAKDIIWLDASEVNNTYALGMLAARSDEVNVKSISDLAAAIRSGKKLTIGVNTEFAARPDGLPGVQKAYDFQVPVDDIKKMDFGLSFQALRDRQVDAAMVTSTDGRIIAFNLVVLKDDKAFFPFYLLAPIARKPVLDANPKLAGLLNSLAKKLDSETMIKLNAQVDVEKRSVEDVAGSFLKSQNMM